MFLAHPAGSLSVDGLRSGLAGPIRAAGRTSSIVDRQWVKTAPNVPCGYRSVGGPGVSDLARLGPRNRLAGEVVAADAFDEATVVERQHVRPHQVEDQEHFGRPTADAADRDQLLDDGFVVHLRP